jgi:hypothetical protein
MISGVINQIRQTGFSIEIQEVDNGQFYDYLLKINPYDKLTAPQLEYLKANKPDIVRALKREHGIQNRTPYDDRRYCHECRNLHGDRCTVTRLSESLDDMPKRCNTFSPLTN